MICGDTETDFLIKDNVMKYSVPSSEKRNQMMV